MTAREWAESVGIALFFFGLFTYFFWEALR